MKLRDNKVLYNFYSIYKYLIYLPYFWIVTAFLASINLIIMFFFGQNAGKLLPVVWARLLAWGVPMFVRVLGKENIDKKQSYVIISNHQSQYDIFALYGWLPTDIKWVMKHNLRKVPFVGYFCYKMGHIFVDRSNSEEAIASINRAKDSIKNGTSIVFFPEGRITETGELLPFKKGGFKFAIDMKLPILPITMINTMNILPSNSALGIFPGRVKLVIHKPISIAPYSEDTIGLLMDDIRTVIQKGLDEHGCSRSVG